MAVHF